MDKEKTSQLELFSAEIPGVKEKNNSFGKPFIFRVRGHEKIIMSIIGGLIIGIISFSMGVEKGKKLTLATEENIVSPEIKISEKKVMPVKAIEPVKAVEPVRAEEKILVDDAHYTIQLACYKNKSFAEREAEALKQKGLTPLILTKGNYIVLCVGKFPNKDKAKPLLPELTRRYKGCYIRGL
ncbi:MAG: SPOR domain-containing protein [Candidatus Omnitrophica bacterium]|nr:SPOR domain-containing protein [Candidatus Omnitrophota bacterium]